MKIIYEQGGIAKPRFGAVKVDQFFVAETGELCQKVSEYTYNVIAKSCGKPYAVERVYACDESPVSRILNTVLKIEF